MVPTIKMVIYTVKTIYFKLIKKYLSGKISIQPQNASQVAIKVKMAKGGNLDP